jgi:hypothetical protein
LTSVKPSAKPKDT